MNFYGLFYVFLAVLALSFISIWVSDKFETSESEYPEEPTPSFYKEESLAMAGLAKSLEFDTYNSDGSANPCGTHKSDVESDSAGNPSYTITFTQSETKNKTIKKKSSKKKAVKKKSKKKSKK